MAVAKVKKPKASLSLKFTVTVMLIFMVAQGSLWGWFLFHEKQLYTNRLEDKVQGLTSLVSELSAEHIGNKDESRIQGFLENIVKDKDILSIKVINSDGSSIAHASQGVEDESVNSNPLYIPYVNTLNSTIVHDGKTLGTVAVIYSGKSVNDDMFHLIAVPPVAQAIVFIVIVIAIFFFTQRMIGKPIEMLKERMAKVTAGDLTVIIPEIGSREIDEVAEGLRFLIKGLSVNVMKLKHVTGSISDAIVNLEKTFTIAIERIKNQSLSTNQIAGSMKLADDSLSNIKDNAGRLRDLISDSHSYVLEINSTEEEMLDSTRRLVSSVDNSYSVVAEMSQTAKVILDNSFSVLGSVENTSASVEEIIASVREVDSSARESSRSAESVRRLAAQKGVASVDRAINSMTMISDRVNYAVEIAKKLDKRSTAAQKILEYIREITEQTNLLSINASILAEQAGEYGKGFTVVAEQMRSLSTKTGGYTKEISAIIKTIQSEVGEVVKAIEHGNEIVKEGSGTVYEVGETMSSILESAHSSASMTKHIERATEDQVLALRHIEESIADVNTLALKMNTAMGEMSTSSSYIHERVSEVKDISEVTSKGIGEFANGVKLISKNLEVSKDDVRKIDDIISEHKVLGQDILGGVESIRNEGVWILTDLEGLSDSIGGLKDEFDRLRREMDAFRLE